MNDDTQRKIVNALMVITLLILGIMWMKLQSSSSGSLQTDSATLDPSDFYERIEVWDLRGDDTVRFTVLDTYPEALKRSKWFSIPPVWKDADIAEATPLQGTLIEQRVKDYDYRGQTYRSHSYFMESDQRQFGYSFTFTVAPHLHVTGTTSRLISIGMDPSYDASIQTKFVLAVILPDGARDITVTDMQPYKTLMSNTRALYYYDIHPITAHQSIHIAYTLTGIPTTDIDLNTVINSSNP